jgi:hypothetical protein
VKEKNILLADSVLEKRIMNSDRLSSRITKVEKTMNRILGVVKER